MDESTSEKTSRLRCECCNSYMPNETSLAYHLKGKKHTQNVNRIESRKEETARTLYISGVQQLDAAELSLADYFSNFGAVAKVTVDKNKGAYAFVEFCVRDSALKALQERSHFISEKEIYVKPRELKLPAVKKPLEKHHVSHGQLPSEVWKALLEAADGESQFHVLQQKFSLPESDKYIRDLVCQLLTASLEEVFHSCEIQSFGSSVNGFGVPGCDMDLNFSYDAVDYEAALQFLTRDQDVGMTCSDENENKLDKKQILSVVAAIIKTCVPDCHQVKTILSARRPVVKFHHRASKMCCDISAGNELAVRNTEFIKYLCDTVPYFAPLVQAVRIWMKHWNLAGSSRIASGLNNYAVTMMVLFYLYNCGELHTLDDMRRRHSDTLPCVIESWDCSFSENSPRNMDAAVKSQSELLTGFFHFYAKLDFDKKVLCLKTGQLEDIADLKQKAEEQSTAHKVINERKFKFGSLNVRDPFELNHNVAGNVGPKHMKTFIRCIRNAALACDMKLFLKKPGKAGNKEPWGILNLFIDHHAKKSLGANVAMRADTENEFAEIKINGKDMTVPGKEVVSLIFTILTDVFLVDILNVSGEKHLLPQSNLISDDEHVLTTPDTVAITVGKGQRPAAETADEGDGSSRKRHRDDDTPIAEKRVKVTLTTPEAKTVKKKALMFGETPLLPATGEARYRVWEGRRKARRQLVQPGVSDILELEKRISKLLVSEAEAQNESFQSTSSEVEMPNKQDLKTFFRFRMSIKFEEECANEEYLLHFDYSPTKEKTVRNPLQDFRNFVRHLQLSLPNMLSKCLKVV